LLVVPVEAGVPLMVADGLPVARVKVAGSAVEVASRLKVYGGTPPLAVIVAV
jgi:hypothetical protein